MAEPTLYLFDGYNLLHAGGFEDPRELCDALASWVAGKGVRGVLVFDGHGRDAVFGPLEVRYADPADTLLERLAAENRAGEQVCIVSSDSVVRGTAGAEVKKLSSQTFFAELEAPTHSDRSRGDMRDKLDAETLAKLERLRRGDL